MPMECKPEIAAKTASLLVGKDHCGHWVVRDLRGLCGGVFTNRKDALRFAMFDCQRTPQSVIMTPYGLELDMTFENETSAVPRMRRRA
jgi:hypothetical protein